MLSSLPFPTCPTYASEEQYGMYTLLAEAKGEREGSGEKIPEAFRVGGKPRDVMRGCEKNAAETQLRQYLYLRRYLYFCTSKAACT